jgi:hypothetical protein
MPYSRVLTEQKRQWAPEPVSKLWIKETSLTLAGNQPRFVGCPSRSVVAVPTELSRFAQCKIIGRSGRRHCRYYAHRGVRGHKIWFYNICGTYRGADKSLARPTSRCILFDGENISFDASLVIYI